MEDKTITVGCEYKRYVQQSGIFQTLLHAFANFMLIGFGLDDGQRQARFMVKHDISGFNRKACG